MKNQAVVEADVKAGYVDEHFLAELVLLVELGCVGRYGDGGGAVVEAESLVDVAGGVHRDYAAADYCVGAVGA